MRNPISSKTHQVDFAEEPYVFAVEREDVRGSVVADTENCAGACALKRDPHIERAWVTRTRTVIQFADDHPDPALAGRMLRWLNPRRLRAAVEQFDSTAGMFPPGSYRLGVIGPGQQRRGHPHRDTGERPAANRKRPSYALR